MDGFDFDKVAQLINLPHDHIIIMMITIGKKLEDARPRSGQLALEEVLFTDQF
jgi:nitroreductase